MMFQYFQWHSPSDGNHWDTVAKDAKHLAERGVTSVWLPPAYKGHSGGYDVGYGVYDLWDLGEFDQKGTVRTKYGTREQYVAAVRALQACGIRAYADVVFNHRLGADETEEVEVFEVCGEDRNRKCSEPYTAKIWAKFHFAGRGGKHSGLKLTAQHFTAFNHAEGKDDRKDVIYVLNKKGFSGEVDFEHGNFDYLMGCDVDMYHPEVAEDLRHWGRWTIDETGVDGFRLDAVKHIPASFFRDWLNHLRAHFGTREVLAFGEYWSADVGKLEKYMEVTQGTMKLFDVPLHFNFYEAGKQGEAYDLTKILDGTLVKRDPLMAVTFVDNHDSQPDCALASFVEPWFKPLAYALILLRKDGYPCVFHADYYGADCPDCKLPSHQGIIDAMLDARRKYCYGDQHDYFDHASCIAWVRTGDKEHPGSLVVIMSNGKDGFKKVQAFANNARFRDITGAIKEEIRTDDKGMGEFRCMGGRVSIWEQV